MDFHYLCYRSFPKGIEHASLKVVIAVAMATPQGTSSQDMGIVLPEYSAVSTRRNILYNVALVYDTLVWLMFYV